MNEEKELDKFADRIVNYSTQIQEGDYVYLILESLQGLDLFEKVREKILENGGIPHEHILYDSQIGSEGMDHQYMKHASEKQLKHQSTAKLKEMQEMDAYIRIGGPENTKELSDIDSKRISIRKKATREIGNERLTKKWVTTRYPTTGLAQNADMSTKEFKQFLFDAINNIDLKKLENRNKKIKEKFDKTKEVKIISEDTEIKMSLENRQGESSTGKHNLPDGEVFYAPIHTSIEGHIKFSYPGTDSGNEISGIYLEFEKGKIINYSADENEEFLEKIIETDEGSKYIGEFGIGTNYQIQRYIKSTIFDEKIGGTIHLAIGRAYERCVRNDDPHGRNESGIHWDLVKDLRNDGKILCDDEVVFEEGEWTILNRG